MMKTFDRVFRGLLALCAFGGCGGVGAGTPFASFIGTWMIADGSTQNVCPPPFGNSTTRLSGNVTIEPGIGGDLVTLDPLGCDVVYNVTGTTATAAGNLSCTRPSTIAGVQSQTIAFSALTLSTSDGKMLTEAGMGTATYTSGAGTLDCTFTLSVTATRVSTH